MEKKDTRPHWHRLLWRRLRVLGALLLVVATIAVGTYLFAPQWIVRATDWHHANSAGLESHELVLDGQMWAYYEGGSGPTIMLLHGFDGTRDSWTKVAGELTGNFRIVIPDLPGWGQSTPVAGADYGPRAAAKHLAGFIERVAPRNVVLIGHSMGGLIAGLYAADHPDHMAAVGFVDSDGVGYQLPVLAGSKNPFIYDDRDGLQHMRSLLFADPPELPGRIADVFVNRNRARMDMLKRSFTELRQNRQAHGLEALLPKIGKPTLVMWCHDDKIISSDAVNVFRKKLTASPRIDVTTLFNCSHMPMLEQPHATAQAITRFMLPAHPR